MRRRLPAAFALLLTGSLLLSSGPGAAGIFAQAQVAPVKLKTITFTPVRGQAPALPAGPTIPDHPEGQRGTYLVQFRGPVEEAWKRQVAALGAELLEYVPEFAFKVRMTPAQARQAQQLRDVTWVGVFQPAYKLSPTLQRGGTRLYAVKTERGADAGVVQAAVARTGAAVLRSGGRSLLVAADSTHLDAIARIVDVAWVENFLLPKKHNDTGAGTIMGSSTANTSGYDGSTQVVAVADTGLGGGTAATAHVDIPATRVGGVYNWRGVDDSCWTITDDGPQDVDSGHGTHVAASVLGDGTAGTGTGTAPAARLVFQAVENWATMKGLCAALYPSGYYLTGLPDDLRTLFQQAYDAGARIHSNSWGSDAAGDYTANSAYADEFVWLHRDMTVTFSAGNAGIDANSDGVVDSDSTGSPATAKNVITVGASENARTDGYPCDSTLAYTACASQGGRNSIFTYGAAWGTDFPAEPLKSDPSAGNAGQMAAFSSRGPTDDNRIKPDVVAPGTWILSGYSDLYQQGYDVASNPKNNAWQYDGWGFPLSDDYKYMGGTSMSNPLVAGGAAVVRDFFAKAHGGHAASAALVKALLINSAVDLADENNDGVNDNRFPIPNNHEGWGRVDLAAATSGRHSFADQATSLATGGRSTSQYTIGTAGSPFKVSLVWTDYPSTEAAAKNLVNDLDLKVTGPDGTVYLGNVFGGGWSQTAGSADRTNNVENVYVQSAAAGTWTVEVIGFNVPSGPQPFALVADGAFGTPATATPTLVPTATNTPTPTNTPAPTGTPEPTSTPGPTSTPTNTPVATETPLPTSTPAATATSSPTATRTATATATATPAAKQMNVAVEAFGPYRAGDWVNVEVRATDSATGAAVSGASVSLTITNPGGTTVATGSATTDSTGLAKFRWKSSRSSPLGTYTARASVTKAGYDAGVGSDTFLLQ